MERGKPKKIWLSPNGQTSPSVCGLPFVSLVTLQMAVVELQRLYHKVGFLPSGYRLRYELGYPFITESPSLSFSIASLNKADSWSVIIPAALYAEREFPESIGECPSIM